tara:strand:- start:8537 stop:9706 length:1170 start_codon:yes stop_codon:yes gene_type:complete
MLSDVVLILILGGGLSWLSLRLRFPNAVAQVLLGVLLGTALLGWVSHTPVLHALGELGVVLLLGVAGLELRLDRLTAAGSTGLLVALFGIVFSVAGGYGIALLYGSPGDEALYVGLVLAATSIGITVQLLQQFGLVGHRIADILLAAAVIDDVIALYLLGAAHGVLSDGFSIPDVLGYVLLAMLVLGGLFVVCRWLIGWLSRRALIDGRWQRGVLTLSAIGLGALLTESLGLSSVVGAFFAGIGVGEGLKDNASEICARDLQPAVLVLMPFFFVMIGVQAQWEILNQPVLLWLVVGLIAIAVVSKAVGGVLGALGVVSWRDRWLIGFGMIARGEVGLIIASIGAAQGHITRPIFVALVLTTIIVSVLGPMLMLPLAKRLRAEMTAGVAR